MAGLAVAAVALAGVVALFVAGESPLVELLVVAGLLVSMAAARAALTVHVDLPSARRRRNRCCSTTRRRAAARRSASNSPTRRASAGSSRSSSARRWDLEALVRGAVDRGADGLAMAGGDGSQAIVAAIAAERGLPYACIPAGTRNHFALDLGVDRDDVVGALDAFVDGGERTVDLAEVNGRVFVNNVSLGLYAEAVQHEGYRDAKLRTLLDTVPDVLGPDGGGLDLRWNGPGGHAHQSGAWCWSPTTGTGSAAPSARGRARGSTTACSGSRSSASPSGRGESGRRLQRPWREWSAPDVRGRVREPVAAGIDGEALVLDPPLRFRIRPGVLRVRIARKHPGASPSAMAPEGLWAGVGELARIAAGRDQKPATHNTKEARWT